MILKNYFYGNVRIKAAVYDTNGNTGLNVYDADTNDLIVTATVNVIDLPQPDELLIKDSQENGGIFSWLVENKVIEPYEDIDTEREYDTALGATLINEELLEQARTLNKKWRDENIVSIHLLDEEDNPLLEDDGITPIIIDMPKSEVEKLEKLAEKKNMSLEEFFIYLIDTGFEEETDKKPDESKDN